MPIKCKYCAHQAPSVAKLNQHMDSAHFDAKPTQCAKKEEKTKKWFECGVCRQRYGHIDGLRYHEQKFQHSKVAVKIEEETAAEETYMVFVENSSINVLNETIGTGDVSQTSGPGFGECLDCNQRLVARQTRCSHCEGLFCFRCKTAHVAAMKAELEKNLTTLGKGLPKLNKRIDDNYEKKKGLLDQAFTRVKNDIRSTIKRLVDELKAREERLIKTAEMNLAAQMKAIELEKQTLKKDVGSIEKYVQLARTNQFKKTSGPGHDRRVETMTNKVKTFEKNLGDLDHRKPSTMRFQPVNRKEVSAFIKTIGYIHSQGECSTPLGDSTASSMISLSFSSAAGSLPAIQTPLGTVGKPMVESPDLEPNWRRSSAAQDLVGCYRNLALVSRE